VRFGSGGRRAHPAGVAPAAAFAFLLASPAINPVVLVSTAVAFPGQPVMVAGRLVASLLTAIGMGWLWLRLGRPGVADADEAGRPAHRRGWDAFWASCRHDLLQAGGFLVIGAFAAAVLNVTVPPRWLEAVADSGFFSVIALALLAVLLSICSEADAFVAASLGQFSLTARLAFLVVGPMVDLKLFADAGRHVRAPVRAALRAGHVRAGGTGVGARRGGVVLMRRDTQGVVLLLVGATLLKVAFAGTYVRYVKPSQLPLIVSSAGWCCWRSPAPLIWRQIRDVLPARPAPTASRATGNGPRPPAWPRAAHEGLDPVSAPPSRRRRRTEAAPERRARPMTPRPLAGGLAAAGAGAGAAAVLASRRWARSRPVATAPRCRSGPHRTSPRCRRATRCR
jgi:hypothetical protein